MGRPLNRQAIAEIVTAPDGPLERAWQAAPVLGGPSVRKMLFRDGPAINIFAIIGGNLPRRSGKAQVTPDDARAALLDHFVGGRIPEINDNAYGDFTALDLTFTDAYAVAHTAVPEGYGYLPEMPFTTSPGRRICHSVARFYLEDGPEVLFVVTVSGDDPQNPLYAAFYQQLATTLMAAIRAELIIKGHWV